LKHALFHHLIAPHNRWALRQCRYIGVDSIQEIFRIEQGPPPLLLVRKDVTHNETIVNAGYNPYLAPSAW